MDDRKAATLVPLIKENVKCGATIYSDEWASYSKLPECGYIHGTVNHSKQFKSKDGVCTNTVEGIWGLLKQKIMARHGIRFDHMQIFLDEFSFRHMNDGNIYHKLIHFLRN